MEVQGLQAAVQRQGRDDLRGLAARPRQVASGHVADRQLQERDQLARAWRARSGSRRSRRGSCCTASASPCRPGPSTSSTARSRWTRRSSAARPATCTRTSQAQDHRDGRQGQDRRRRRAERGGEVRAAVVPDRKRATLKLTSARTSSPARPSTPTRWVLHRSSSRLRARDHRSRRALRRRAGPHERHRELLEPAQARPARHLRQRGALPPVPLPR